MRIEPTGRSRMLGLLVAVCVALGLSAVPGMASAAPSPHLAPTVDCTRVNDDGTVTLILGYESTHPRTWTYAHGRDNTLAPSRLQGAQPTRFEPGTHSGVFSLQLTEAELATFTWTLARDTVNGASAPTCAPATPLPALGNGTGLAIALLAGGAFGVFFVRRSSAAPPSRSDERRLTSDA